MPLNPQFRTVLDTFEAKGLVRWSGATSPRPAPAASGWRRAAAVRTTCRSRWRRWPTGDRRGRLRPAMQARPRLFPALHAGLGWYR